MSCQQVSRLTTTAVKEVSSEDQDPYVFTETVPTTPPILFNAQKSRSRVFVDAQAITTTTPPIPIQTLSPTAVTTATNTAPTIATPASVALTIVTAALNNRQTTPTVTRNNHAKLKFNQKLPLGPLNGNNSKTQATTTLAAATGHNGPTAAATSNAISSPTVKMTNSQSQSQKQQQRKALNVCIVRPQQQQQPLTPTLRQQQQQHFKEQQRKQASSPPPLLQHTPSLWQTPLLLDTTSAVVSPPTSPASLPSPTIETGQTPASVSLSTAATTAMVSPLITVSATPLPPSKFHHNTLAQHLQKVECIKKPKKSIVGVDSKPVQQFSLQQINQEECVLLKQHQPQPQQLQLQPQHFNEVGTKTVVVQPTTALTNAKVTKQSQTQMQMQKPYMATSSAPPPLQAIQAVTPPQHSDSDLNEIPVNVIFRKPQASNERLHSQLSGNVNVNASGNNCDKVNTKVDNRSSVHETTKKITTNIKPKNMRIIPSIAQPKKKSVANMDVETTRFTATSLQPPPSVVRDIVFTQTGTAKFAPNKDPSTPPAHLYNTPRSQPPAAIAKQQQNMSSVAKPLPPPPPPPPLQTQMQPLKYDTTITPAHVVRKSEEVVKNMIEEQSYPLKIADTNKIIAAVKATSATVKNVPKRKTSVPPTFVTKNKNHLPPFVKKRINKMGPLYRAHDNQIMISGNAVSESYVGANVKNRRNHHAVAVVKMTAAEIEADTTFLASATVLPYCVQKHWLYITRESQLFQGVASVAGHGKSVGTIQEIFNSASDRESYITQRKMLLHRQAMQLLSTHSLQKLPMQAAKRRLMCVDRLLRKYQRHGGEDIIAKTKCNFVGCTKVVLEMATQCEDHIVNNMSQHIFLPCTAKFADNTQCRIPVFDIIHDLPLCTEHARKRDAYNRAMHDQQRSGNHKSSATSVTTTMTQYPLDCDAGDLLHQLQQIKHQHKQQQQQQLNTQSGIFNTAATMGKSKKSVNVKATTTRKRKASNTPAANTVGRTQKRARKVGINGTPSVSLVAATIAPLQLTSAVLQRKSSTTSLESIASNSQSSNSQPHYIPSNMNVQAQCKIAMPALAPLSGNNAPILSNTLTSVSAPKRMLHFNTNSVYDSGATIATNIADKVMSQDFKPHEINQMVAQFSVAVNNNNSNNNSTNHSNENSNCFNSYNSNSINNCYNYITTNCDSNFTSALGSSSSLPSSSEELFRQDLMSVCENSSAYASSEDTGLGGLSETELMVGPNDADDIPLGDTRLLEEQDLANVLSALPEDAFNELFTAVHQDEREEVERALELADKHLKSLQQTIGSDIDFLGDFPDDDEILADTDAMCSKMDIVSSVINSPDATSGIDTSTLFIDSGSNSVGGGGGSGSISSTNITDIRGLVQT